MFTSKGNISGIYPIAFMYSLSVHILKVDSCIVKHCGVDKSAGQAIVRTGAVAITIGKAYTLIQRERREIEVEGWYFLRDKFNQMEREI